MRRSSYERGGSPVGAGGRGGDQQFLRRRQAAHLAEELDQGLAPFLRVGGAAQPDTRGDDLGKRVGEAAGQLLKIKRAERRRRADQVDRDGIKHCPSTLLSA